MNTIVKKHKPVFFNFSTKSQVDKGSVLLVQNRGKIQKNTIPKIKHSSSGFTLQHVFDKTGLFDVHLKIKDRLIATYVITVKN